MSGAAGALIGALTRPERERERSALAVGLTFLCLLAFLLLAGTGAQAEARPSSLALLLCGAFLPYSLLLFADEERSPWVALGLAALGGSVLLLLPPLLSDDVYRYLWDGRVAAHGFDPYRFAPEDPALHALRDELFPRINHPEIPTIYPLGAQALFRLADAIGHHPRSLQLLALLAHLGATGAVAALARGPAGEGSAGEGPRGGGRAALLYGLHPLALSEAASGAHVDVFCGLALALAALALLRRRGWLAALAVAAATAFKGAGLLLVPLLRRDPQEGRGRGPLRLALLLSLLVMLPVLTAGYGSDARSGLTHYSRSWRGNEGGFVVAVFATRVVVDAVALASGAPFGWIRLPFVEPALEAVEGTDWDPRATRIGEKKARQRSGTFETAYLSELLAKAWILVGLLWLGFRLARSSLSPLQQARWLLLVGLFFAPQVHPWYLLWLLPIEVAAGGLAGWVWSATVLLAYAPLDLWREARIWSFPPLAQAIEYTPVVLVAAWELSALRRASRGASVENTEQDIS